MKKFKYTAVTLGLTLSMAALCQAQTLTWDFGVGVPNNAPSSGSLTGASVSGFSLGNSNGVVANMINTTSPSSGYAGSSGSENLGNAVLVGGLDIATSSYYQFTLTANAGFTVSLTDLDFGIRSTTTGPQAYSLRSDADGFGSDLFMGTITNNSTWSFKDNTITNAPVSADGGTIVYRLYTYGGAGVPGAGTQNNRIDDVSMSVAVAAVPEPGTVALIGLGLGAVLFGMRRRCAA